MRCNNNLKQLKGKKILLAGGTGFIGKRVAEVLERHGVQVVILTRRKRENTSNITYWKADLNEYEELKQYSEKQFFDAVLYMAANIPLAGSKKETYYEAKCSTLDPFVNFCDCFLRKTSKMIYVSSVDVLGACADFEYDERVLPNITTPYGLAKYCGEFYAKNICEQLGIEYKIYRFAQVFGPNEPVVRVIPILKNALLKGVEFNLYTDGTEMRKFLYIEDAVQAIICGLLSDRKGIYNIAGNEVITLNDLIVLMEKVWNKKLKICVFNKIVGIDNVPSIEKAKKELGFMPCYSIYQGLLEIREKEKNA